MRGSRLIGGLGFGGVVVAALAVAQAQEPGSAPLAVSGVKAWLKAPPAAAGARGPSWDRDAAGAIDFERLRGKVVVLEFWATWCPPCRASIPHLNELQRDHRDDVVVIGLTALDHQQTEEQVRQFVGEKVEYAVGILEDGAVLERYGIEGIPHAVVIGRDGKVVWTGNPLSDDFAAQVTRASGPVRRPAPTSRPSR